MDLTAIQTALGLVSTAVAATGQAATTADAFKKLFSSGKSSDDEGVRLLNSLATQLTTANMMNLQLSDTLKTIQQEIRENDEFDREKKRYELVSTPEGDMVYRLKPDMREGQLDHCICPVCLNKRTFNFITGSGDYEFCQADMSHRFHFHRSAPAVGYVIDSGF